METSVKVNNNYLEDSNVVMKFYSCHHNLTATVIYDTNFQILQFFMDGKDDCSQQRTKDKFAQLWK